MLKVLDIRRHCTVMILTYEHAEESEFDVPHCQLNDFRCTYEKRRFIANLARNVIKLLIVITITKKSSKSANKSCWWPNEDKEEIFLISR